MSEAAAIDVDTRSPEVKHATAKFGMWMFLASEIMFFTGFIGSYIVVRIANPEVMARGARWGTEAGELNVYVGGFNTIILILSSLTMALGIAALGRKDVKWARIFLSFTIALALAFLVVKLLYEWPHKFELGINWSTSIFYSFYFMITGFHGLHVLGGIVMMFCLLVCDDGYLKNHMAMVENTGLYWHFVDIVWIFLFPMFYLMP